MAGATGAVSTAGLGGRIASAAADKPLLEPSDSARLNLGGSLSRAYEFLTLAMDAYQQGSTTRLIQSYSDELGQGSTAFVYDNAITIIAYLRRARRDDVARAMLLGDSFLYAQTHDETYADGRVR